MSQLLDPPTQGDLFASTTQSTAFDTDFSTLERVSLDDECWIDYAREWLQGSERLFDELLRTRTWRQRKRWMYEKEVLEPRLTAYWTLESGSLLEPALLDEMRLSLSSKYGVLFDSVGFNLYRDGQDAVAWHGDKIRKEIAEPIVALLSLGERRRLLMRRKEGGPSRAYFLGRGDLFVTGGRTQRKWQHSVPRTSNSGPRISVAFRHGMNARAYRA